MSTVAIPEWNLVGLLPPINSDLPTSPERSPYPVRLLDVVMRFGTTPERRRILQGFLNYRAAWHVLGLTVGFQWLDGSFMEDVETLERRAPRDIDVVSFVNTPNGFSPSEADMLLFDHEHVKAQFLVDAYMVGMSELSLDGLVSYSAYWYSVWSHRRNQAWKGFLKVDLAPTDDPHAQQWLSQFDSGEVAV